MTPGRERLKRMLENLVLTEEEQARLRRLSPTGNVDEGRDALADAFFDDSGDDPSDPTT